jgi:hypothetical protein
VTLPVREENEPQSQPEHVCKKSFCHRTWVPAIVLERSGVGIPAYITAQIKKIELKKRKNTRQILIIMKHIERKIYTVSVV